MVFEHIALNVEDTHSVKNWYVSHLGLKVAREQLTPPFMTFLEDSSGRVIMELYHRSDEKITKFTSQHPLTFHMAFVSTNAEQDKIRLLGQGASFIEEVNTADGSHLIMLRDPWGMPLQLCQRANPF